MPDQILFVRQPQPARRGAGGDDDRSRLLPFLVDVQAERPLGEVNLEDGAVNVLGAEALSLFLHGVDQGGPCDAVRESRKIFDVAGQRELAAGLMPEHDQGF